MAPSIRTRYLARVIKSKQQNSSVPPCQTELLEAPPNPIRATLGHIVALVSRYQGGRE